jgi:hypothetical protein
MVINFDLGRNVRVTGQQRMLTPPRHLIPSSPLSGVRVALTRLCISFLDYDLAQFHGTVFGFFRLFYSFHNFLDFLLFRPEYH